MKRTRSSEQKINDQKSSDEMVPKRKQMKPYLSSTERVCNRCKCHQIIVSIKGHKCEYIGCDCIKCRDYEEKRKRRHQTEKNRMISKKVSFERSVPHSIVKSLKAKTNTLSKNRLIKVLNKTIENNVNETKKSTNKDKNAIKVKLNQNKRFIGNRVNQMQDMETEIENDQVVNANDCMPPELVPEIIISNASPKPSTMTRNEEIASNSNIDSYPVKTSASQCAQYLKGCEELSRRLLKSNLTEDELMGCLKYSIVSYCLGDVEMATQKIIFASQEIRSGALYNIQHPSDQQVNVTVPILNSTFNTNYRPINAITYNPGFTPIRPD